MIYCFISRWFYVFSYYLAIVDRSLAMVVFIVIILGNNTPPASRKNSAPRGVTHLWTSKNYKVKLLWGQK